MSRLLIKSFSNSNYFKIVKTNEIMIIIIRLLISIKEYINHSISILRDYTTNVFIKLLIRNTFFEKGLT